MDSTFTFTAVGYGACKDCGGQDAINSDPRCVRCAEKFVEKIRGIAIHAEPWGLRQARKDGFAKF